MAVILALALAWLAQAAGSPAPQATSGTIEGRIVFEGTVPPPAFEITGSTSQQVIYVGRDGGLQYAVVAVTDAAAGTRQRPATPAVLDQREFVFEPQVLAVRAGQAVRFTSQDPADHMVRSADRNPINAFNVTTPSGAAGTDTHVFAATPLDRPVELSCDIHPWMAAWLYVFDHEQFAVTDATGVFRIAGVPPGSHRIAVRQPSGGLQRDVTVAVKAGETSRVDVRFTAADLQLRRR